MCVFNFYIKKIYSNHSIIQFQPRDFYNYYLLFALVNFCHFINKVSFFVVVLIFQSIVTFFKHCFLDMKIFKPFQFFPEFFPSNTLKLNSSGNTHLFMICTKLWKSHNFFLCIFFVETYKCNFDG